MSDNVGKLHEPPVDRESRAGGQACRTKGFPGRSYLEKTLLMATARLGKLPLMPRGRGCSREECEGTGARGRVHQPGAQGRRDSGSWIE